MPEITASELLRLSGAYMDEHGMCKRAFQNLEGNVCARGAINRVAVRMGVISNDVLHPTHARATRALDAVALELGYVTSMHMNDMPEVDQAMMVKAFYQAADNLDAGIV